MLNHAKGNLITMAKNGDFDVIVHGCNCFNVMGAGIAAQIAVEFPDARVADDETIKGDPGKLGSYTLGISDTVLVLNAYTQYGTASHADMDVFEYTSFERVLSKIVNRFGGCRIGLPLIGMGLAGGDKNRIMPLIEAFARRVSERGGEVTLVEFSK
jgi:O-acetyl-ADP-ribose deacetylase (regulator of RNase III)